MHSFVGPRWHFGDDFRGENGRKHILQLAERTGDVLLFLPTLETSENDANLPEKGQNSPGSMMNAVFPAIASSAILNSGDTNALYLNNLLSIIIIIISLVHSLLVIVDRRYRTILSKIPVISFHLANWHFSIFRFGLATREMRRLAFGLTHTKTRVIYHAGLSIHLHHCHPTLI